MFETTSITLANDIPTISARPRGRPPQPQRRLLAAQLRSEGLTLAEVGRCLGVTRQAAWELLKKTPASAIPV